MLLNCISCYCDFEQREGFPALQVCEECEPDANNLSETRCPKCGWDCESITHDENAPVEVLNRYSDWELGYCGGEHWTEKWTCPECATVFQFNNSSV